MPGLSQRIKQLKASSTIAFNTRAADLRRQGIDVIAMTAGEPDFQPPEHVMEAAREAIRLGLTKYTPPRARSSSGRRCARSSRARTG